MIGVLDLIYGGVVGHVDRLRDRTGDEGLHGSHHVDMGLPGDGPVCRVEDGDVLL